MSKTVCLACTKLSEEEYRLLSKETTSVYWYCPTCSYHAFTDGRTDMDIGARCKQHFVVIRREMKQAQSELDTKFSKSVEYLKADISNLRKEVISNQLAVEGNVEEKLSVNVE
jgi:DNA-directed RNA polymerase subunit RPC12/RpoP